MQIFQFSERLTVLPLVHGSGDFAIEVRRLLLEKEWDCLAVPIPASFAEPVEQAIDLFPLISVVYQREQSFFSDSQWQPDDNGQAEEEADLSDHSATYVPIDPCQPVIAAIRIARQEHIRRAYIDAEVADFQPLASILPDPYAVKKLQSTLFATGTIPVLPEANHPQLLHRAAEMAYRLKHLQLEHRKILALCSFLEWLPLKRAFTENWEKPDNERGPIYPVLAAPVADKSLHFVLGELPFVTGRYEQARFDLDDDENLSVEGLKQLMLATREKYRSELGARARPITPKLLATYFRYVRNLALTEHRLTPDLYTLVKAAQQIFGDQFAIHLLEMANTYPYVREAGPRMTFGIDRSRLPDGQIVTTKNRLPGHPQVWRSCQLQTRPPKIEQKEWLSSWNNYTQCSWPPEDVAIERFREHVKDDALKLLGNDLARTEKFTTSLKDGLDIRETLRNWHTGDLYVKELPPTRGGLDCVVMLFDSPADPREYPWRITWHAEHDDESTLSFFATNFLEQMVGPGIALGQYGGAMFLFPPREIPDIWNNARFDFVDTLEERLIVAGCHYSQEKHIAILSDAPPGIAWKKLAQRAGKKLIHVPLKKFSQQTVQQLRMFHILNGQQVRSYAAHFIRKA